MEDGRRFKLINIEFTSFNATIAEPERDTFLDELEAVCNKYAGDDWVFNWEWQYDE